MPRSTGIQVRLRELQAIGNVDQRWKAMTGLAIELGCSPQGISGLNGVIDEPELVRRIQEADRSHREHRLWIVAAASMAIALLGTAGAVLSAWASWRAVDAPRASDKTVSRLLDENAALRAQLTAPQVARKAPPSARTARKP